jgi:hypothetical protein
MLINYQNKTYKITYYSFLKKQFKNKFKIIKPRSFFLTVKFNFLNKLRIMND